VNGAAAAAAAAVAAGAAGAGYAPPTTPALSQAPNRDGILSPPGTEAAAQALSFSTAIGQNA
jgi:hypothetical protein